MIIITIQIFCTMAGVDKPFNLCTDYIICCCMVACIYLYCDVIKILVVQQHVCKYHIHLVNHRILNSHYT